ncbi:MAG: FixH family protein [Hydrogenophilaceae bacterium]|nr:FixH family protein [Hydrogenophilaceae bacterium]
MNLLYTLFGGMLLTAAIYGGLRRVRVGNFWAAVAASGGVSLAYIVYAIFDWAGLDTLAMHLVAYPTVAVVLAQLYDTRKAQALHWAPKLIVALFLAVSVLFGGLAYISSHGLPQLVARWFLPNAQDKNLHTGFAGVVAHSQEAAKGIGQHLKVEHALAQLGWQVDVQGLNELSVMQESEVVVQLSDRDGRGVEQARLALALARPGQPAGRPTVLAAAGPGRYQARLDPHAAGAWIAYLRIEAAGRGVELEHTVEVR